MATDGVILAKVENPQSTGEQTSAKPCTCLYDPRRNRLSYVCDFFLNFLCVRFSLRIESQ